MGEERKFKMNFKKLAKNIVSDAEVYQSKASYLFDTAKTFQLPRKYQATFYVQFALAAWALFSVLAIGYLLYKVRMLSLIILAGSQIPTAKAFKVQPLNFTRILTQMESDIVRTEEVQTWVLDKLSFLFYWAILVTILVVFFFIVKLIRICVKRNSRPTLRCYEQVNDKVSSTKLSVENKVLVVMIERCSPVKLFFENG